MKKYNFKYIATLLFASLLMFSLSASAQEGSPLKGLFADDYAFVMEIAPVVVAISEAHSKTIDTYKETDHKVPIELLSSVGAIVSLPSGESPFERSLFIATLTESYLILSLVKPSDEGKSGGNVEVGWRKTTTC